MPHVKVGRTGVLSLVLATLLVMVPGTSSFAASPDDGAQAQDEATRILQEQGYSTTPDSFVSSRVTVAEDGSSFTVKLEKAGASGFSVVCGGTTSDNAVRDPHYSSGAGGAIYKTEIWCSGTGLATVNVRTQGPLTFVPSSSSTNTNVTFSKRAGSDQTQTVVVNGTGKTYYTPLTGSNGGRGTGFWRATSTWYFVVNGVYSTVGSQTKTVWKTI
ncbi:hypothetical protein [uncultured Microbacterium sp.]|uniref:hypothetical protein n=1 Tax=uncultured Microbacterium sp. TaxID=191216 RepID=UPI002604A772|nr:hypothetical protein [uncultured Microbacterium sp.]